MEKEMTNKEREQHRRDILHTMDHREEWNTTRLLFAQLCVLNAAQMGMLRLVSKRLDRHGLFFTQQQKMLFKRVQKYLLDAKKAMEDMDIQASKLGYKIEDFCRLNDAMAKEGYDIARLILNWQNATYHQEHRVKEIEDYLNAYSTGKKRVFSKKMIDTLRLEEDKVN